MKLATHLICALLLGFTGCKTKKESTQQSEPLVSASEYSVAEADRTELVKPKSHDYELEIISKTRELTYNDPRLALDYIEERINEESSAPLLFIAANLCFQYSKHSKATELYLRSIKIEPNFLKARKNLGLLLAKTGQHAEAGVHLQKAYDLGDQAGETAGLLAFCYLNSDDLRKAEKYYWVAVQLDPTTEDWKTGLVRCLFERKAFTEAEPILDELIALAPENSNYLKLKEISQIELTKLK